MPGCGLSRRRIRSWRLRGSGKRPLPEPPPGIVNVSLNPSDRQVQRPDPSGHGRYAPECHFMAHLLITGDVVTIHMSRGERFEAAHGDQTFPRSAISGVRTVPDCIAEVRGLKWAGTELPGIRIGSFHEDQRVTFAVCHGHNPGIVIDLANSKYDKVILTVDNAEEIAARLAEPPS